MAWTELEETNQQFLEAWKALAQGAEQGTVAEFDGVAAMYSRVPVAFLNVFGLTRPVIDLADLQIRALGIRAYARGAKFPYFVTICDEWLAEPVRPLGARVLAGVNLHPFMRWTGMVTERLLPARRQVEGLEIRPVADRETRIAVNDLNSVAYDMPAEPGREPLARDAVWANMFGSVGYLDGEPVSTATALPLDGCLYVTLVATHPDYRRRGFAEACMRDSLERAGAATGLHRSVLHATEEGYPVYQKMGYRDTAHFTLYGEPG